MRPAPYTASCATLTTVFALLLSLGFTPRPSPLVSALTFVPSASTSTAARAPVALHASTMSGESVTFTTKDDDDPSPSTPTPTTIEFSKYHGLGNDFLLIDARSQSSPPLTPEQSAALCDRNFGVGGDGVIFALKPSDDSDSDQRYDFAMRIYNSDGSEPEMCGNGIRCLAQFLADLGEDATSYSIDTLAGPIVPVMNEDGTITVDMGEPILSGPDVPCTLEPNSEHDSIVEQPLTLSNGKTFKINAVSMGNPHAIIFVDDMEKDIDFEVDGPVLESNTDAFPAKTNVEFVQVASPSHLVMKVWERGAGPTLACGTGACALTVAAIRANKIPRAGEEGTRVTLPGGDLFIEWREENNRVYMKGPATLAFRGTAVVR